MRAPVMMMCGRCNLSVSSEVINDVCLVLWNNHNIYSLYPISFSIAKTVLKRLLLSNIFFFTILASVPKIFCTRGLLYQIHTLFFYKNIEPQIVTIQGGAEQSYLTWRGVTIGKLPPYHHNIIHQQFRAIVQLEPKLNTIIGLNHHPPQNVWPVPDIVEYWNLVYN